MSVQIINSSEFTEMPWKNGGGFTTELFRVHNGNDFKFRISKAQIKNDGPFSIFPHIDRIIMLDRGNGFSLKGPNVDEILKDIKTVFHFRGEESIECHLLDGPCIDFNVMTDRRYATTSLALCELNENESVTFTSTNSLTIIYDSLENKIYKMDLKDSCSFNATTSKNLYVIGVDFNE